MVNDKKPKSLSLEEEATELGGDSAERAIRALWRLSDSGSMPSRPESQSNLVYGAIQREAARLRLLLTENTCIRTIPFLEFSNRLSKVISEFLKSEEQIYKHLCIIKELFADYRLNAQNFSSLQSKARIKQVAGNVEPFVCCVSGESNEVFVTASGDVDRVLIHFDQWLSRPDTCQQLTNKYVHKLDSILSGDQWGIVVVKKKYGPIGPEAIWPDLRKSLGRRIAEYFYDQNSEKGEFRTPVPTPPKQYVVLYDLIKSGDGLNKIDVHLKEKLGTSNIKHLILYDYRVGNTISEESKIDLDSDRDITLFDGRDSYDLLHKNLFRYFCDAPKIGEAEPREVFERIKLEDVGYMGRRKSFFYSDVESILLSNETSRNYAGKWVAVTNEEVLLANENVGELMTQLEKVSLGVVPFVDYIQPVGATEAQY